MFQRRLNVETARAIRYRRRLAVALVDLDDFKAINDTVGHLVGDRVLTEVARRITAAMRGEALVARVGGDEFALLLPECDDMRAYSAAERARSAVSVTPIAHCGRVTISVGVADLGQAQDGQGLLRLADAALYAARLHGRDSCMRYSAALVPELAKAAPAGSLARARTHTGLLALARAIDAEGPRYDRAFRACRRTRQRASVGASGGRDASRGRARARRGQDRRARPDLFAPRRLKPDEYEQVKRHAELSAQLAADVLSDDQVCWIRWHHERADGHGYPDGLTAEQLPEGAKLLAVADAWDAMTTARSYSAVKPVADALAECRKLAGRQFAPEARCAAGSRGTALADGPVRPWARRRRLAAPRPVTARSDRAR